MGESIASDVEGRTVVVAWPSVAVISPSGEELHRAQHSGGEMQRGCPPPARRKPLQMQAERCDQTHSACGPRRSALVQYQPQKKSVAPTATCRETGVGLLAIWPVIMQTKLLSVPIVISAGEALIHRSIRTENPDGARLLHVAAVDHLRVFFRQRTADYLLHIWTFAIDQRSF